MSTKENTQNKYAQGCQEVQKAGGNMIFLNKLT